MLKITCVKIMLFRKRTTILLIFSIFAMAAFALLREIYFFPKLDLIPNPDSAWLIYAAGRWLDGQKLYVDIMETNPPLIIWLSAIPVYIARLIHTSEFTVAVILVTTLNLLSIFLCAKALKNHKILSEKLAFSAVLLFIAFCFFILTPALYGQRETLFIALILPYLLWSLPSSSSVIRHPSSIIAMAALGFALKPFFLLIWGVNELVAAIEKRSIKGIFAWHNWVIGFAQVAYFLSIYFITPEYISDIFPALKLTYFTFESPWETILKPIAEVGGAAFLVLMLAKLRGDFVPLTLRIIAWFLACAGLILIQRKDWLNHEYPMFFMASLTIVIAIIFLIGEWGKLKLDIGHRKFLALCLAIGALIIGVYLVGAFHKFMFTQPSKISQKLLIEINEEATGKEVYPLNYSLQPSFPTITVSNGIFSGGFHHLWPMSGLVIGEQNGDKSPEFLKTKQWFMDILVRDFTNHPPALVWVDENVNLEKIGEYDINPENRDIITVLSRDARFAKIWQNYQKTGEIIAEEYPDAEKEQTEEEKNKKPDKLAIYQLKN